MSIVRSFPWMTKRYSAIDGRRNRSVAEWFRGSTKKVLEAFLPAEYKTSVTPEYMSYMKWQFVHNTLGAASGVLSTQALLYAMGLGTGALPLSAAINWVIKDGFGQLGGVLYATMVGQKFDSDPKHLRFWSAVWLQSATWLEMLAPLAPHLFILIGSAANVGKNISWLAMSATKASINKSFCLKENLGDLTAKHGSQATAAGLLGTAAGILIGATMDITIYTLIIGFVPISLLSLWGNYKSLLCTITPSLNLERASHMVSEAVSVDPHGQLALDPYMLKSPRQVSEVERFMRETRHISPNGMLPGIALLPDIGKIHRELPDDVGAEHKQAIVAEMVSSAFCPQTTDRTWSENYYIGYLAGSTANKSRNGNIYLWFSTQATSRDMLFGLYHSIALRQLLGQAPGIGDADAVAELSDQAYHFARHSFADFGESLIIKGWDISTVYLAKRSDLVQVGVSKN
ncbi:hypothetical protein LPJ53_000662 [Coemansia erecta]|uniref:Protein root UVB sensitive/RUS domain-containing protein n=1 Tax=Coemansia erecta TaxID=147472 RepID=A0A9W7Y1G0_9FUNG|nr:hypothetical protein LPJ53_000662 [Coemansia erecta]